jgi:hydroxyacylglutathione hydrolase
MIEKITDDVFKIKGDSNVYVILNPEPFLIDASNRDDSNYIRDEIIKIVPIESIKKVILTHLHYDHVGNIDLFKNAKVYVSKEDLDDLFKNPDLFFLSNISGTVLDILRNAKVLPEEINGLDVVKVPGHTKGCVAFFDKRRKILFSGDTLFENGIGRCDFLNSVPNEMKNSVEKLKKLVLENNLKLCSGHDY